MENKLYTEEEIVSIIETLLQNPDILIDAVSNEYTIYNAKVLLNMIENKELNK